MGVDYSIIIGIGLTVPLREEDTELGMALEEELNAQGFSTIGCELTGDHTSGGNMDLVVYVKRLAMTGDLYELDRFGVISEPRDHPDVTSEEAAELSRAAKILAISPDVHHFVATSVN